MNSFADSDSHLAEAGAYSTSVVIGGLPIGIWGVMVLMRPDARSSFT
jgi:hypothetical protein